MEENKSTIQSKKDTQISFDNDSHADNTFNEINRIDNRVFTMSSNLPFESGKDGVTKKEREDIEDSEGEIGQEERDSIERLLESTIGETTTTTNSSSSSSSKQRIPIPLRKRRFSLEPMDSIHLSPASIAASSKISCLECRASKTRCSGGEICERCKRLNRECVYKEHRRGRFSDSKRVQHLERVVQSLLGQLRSLQSTTETSTEKGISTSASSSTHSNGNGNSSISTAPALPDQQNDLWKIVDSRSSSPLLDAKQTTLESLLSHPLRFLAHFGKDVGLNEDKQHSISQTDYQDTLLNAQIGDYTPRITPSISAATESRRNSIDQTSFLHGLRNVKLDRFDPIDMGVISISKAEELFKLYFDSLESSVAMFDLQLHSFEFVRMTSSFLLTTICFIASMFDMESGPLSNKLEVHIHKIILPAILTQDYRSVEIVQAFVLLAYYHPQVTTLSKDRSWLFIGYASRIGWELGMNTSMQNALSRFPNDLELIKRVRNRERTWLNVWIAEMALCELMGMAPMMRFDTMVISSSSWHLHPQALIADHAIVALVQLRLILARQAEMFERFILSNQTHTNEIVEMMKITYKQSIEQLDAWSNAWSQDPYATNISSQHPRFRRARICYWYARSMSASRALRFTFETTQTTFPLDLYLDIFNASTAFLHQVIHTQNAIAFQYSNNCSIILPTYCCCVCLSLIGIMNSPSIDSSRLHMDIRTTFDLITKVSETLNQAASITPHRRGAASNYGPFLKAVLEKTKEKYIFAQQQQKAIPQGMTNIAPPVEEKKFKGKEVSSRNVEMQNDHQKPTPLRSSSTIAPVQQGYNNSQFNLPSSQMNTTRNQTQNQYMMGIQQPNSTNSMFNEQNNPIFWQSSFPNQQSGMMQQMNINQQQPTTTSGDPYSHDLEGAQFYNLIFGPSNYYSTSQQQHFQQNQKPS